VAAELVDHGFLPDVSEAIARANIILEQKKDNLEQKKEDG
jgi:hypothetical protein